MCRRWNGRCYSYRTGLKKKEKMIYTSIRYSELDPLSKNNIVTIAFNQPDSKVNVFSEAVLVELNDAIDRVAADNNVKGVIFTSSKPDTFIAGADVKVIQALQNDSPIKAYDASKIGKMIFDKIVNLKVPTVAAIHGKCLGGGTEFILACRYRIASNSPATAIALPEVKLGVVPGWAATVRLPKLIGLEGALSLILTGKEVDARKAWKLGLVDEYVDQDKLILRAQQIINGASVKNRRVSTKDQLIRFFMEKTPIGRDMVYKVSYKGIMRETKGKYPAPVEALKLIIRNCTRSTNEAYEAESNTFAHLATSEISRNLVNIFFAQSESKKLPADVSFAQEIKTVGVLGAGVMGAGIAQAAAYAGYKVILKDIDQRFVDSGMSKITKLFDNLVERHKIKPEERNIKLANIKGTIDYADLSDCDLVIEAVLEDIQVKTAALAAVEQVNQKPFIFATNTSSLSVNELARASGHPDRIVGLHFFNPVHKMPLVEVVKGEFTSPEILAAAQAFALKLGKTTVITNDGPGFVVNRVLVPYLREAVVLLEQGVPPESIEKAATSFGMPMGPFTLLDEIGLDIGVKVTHVLYKALGERVAPPALMDKLESTKLLGKKGGKGFYLYEDGKRTEFNPEVLAAITAPPNKKHIGEIQDRLFLIMLNEATRCLEEKIITDPRQLDLALIFGIGFPPYRGGILRYADHTGLKIVHQKLAFLSQVAGDNYTPAQILLEKVATESNFYQA